MESKHRSSGRGGEARVREHRIGRLASLAGKGTLPIDIVTKNSLVGLTRTWAIYLPRYGAGWTWLHQVSWIPPASVEWLLNPCKRTARYNNGAKNFGEINESGVRTGYGWGRIVGQSESQYSNERLGREQADSIEFLLRGFSSFAKGQVW
jgi:hypothetical protein